LNIKPEANNSKIAGNVLSFERNAKIRARDEKIKPQRLEVNKINRKVRRTKIEANKSPTPAVQTRNMSCEGKTEKSKANNKAIVLLLINFDRKK
jgi:hypothetical protein